MLTDQGPQIIETHVRPGGDNISILLKLVSEVDMMEVCARQIVGEEVAHLLPKELPENSFAAIWYAAPQCVGVVNSIDGIEEARSIPDVHQVEILASPGKVFEGMHDSFSRAAFAIASGTSPEKAVRKAKEAVDLLKFVVTCSSH